MNRIGYVIAAVVLCLLMSNCSLQPAPPRIVIPEASTAVLDAQFLRESFSVQVQMNGSWISLPVHTLNAHENGRLEDGHLAILPLEFFLSSVESAIPVLPLTEDFTVAVVHGDYPEQITCRPQLLRYETGTLVRVDADILPPETLAFNSLAGAGLEEGMYLLRLDIHVEREQDYYTGSAFVWLAVDMEVPASWRPWQPPGTTDAPISVP